MLVYAQHRWYDPETAQFTSEDPIMDSMNWYAYCAGDPINCIDPLGLYTDYSDPSKEPTHHDSPDDFTDSDGDG
ncbi:MAG: hypothetical protein MJB14_01745, partial [Spirochaetes bacterium]|nr:hypothetical protein [Spirochaetota bacterium]